MSAYWRLMRSCCLLLGHRWVIHERDRRPVSRHCARCSEIEIPVGKGQWGGF